MSSDNKVKAWAAFEVAGKVKEFEFEREVKPDDVRVKVECCGICYSCVHKIDSHWGKTNYPFVGGHEIVGEVVEVGSNVSSVKIGQRVGVGPIAGACLECDDCKANMEHVCAKRVFNYDAVDHHGRQTYGGYASHTVVPAHFAIPIPDGMDSITTAPLLCAGITVFAPLRRHITKPNMKVAINAIGGLGHLAVQFAKALGAHVTAISRTDSKKALSIDKLGADAYIASSDPEQLKAAAGSFDLLLHTAAFNGGIDSILALVKSRGNVCLVGVPDENYTFNAFSLIAGERTITSSLVGSPQDTRDMLEFALKHDIKTHVSSVVDMDEAQKVNDALDSMRRGEPRFRIVLKN
eukprot:TRINITY_DN70_c0_g1_i1.p2 TRINITY_DN70_c0_g1~~TRINITY_DN70_c0_g1_i1.p2  ORF type:complete len:350 (-),score=186.53 TRINITY_DN70_c0_g1_i1:99-1148(-)